jgi:hypothetical protein
MKTYDEKYHIKIKPELLFDPGRVFKSNYTPWVYVHLKIQKNFLLQTAPHKMYQVNAAEIADDFETHVSTVYDCLEELTKAGLLVNKGTQYRLLPESNYSAVDTPNYIREYVQVYPNTFTRLLNDVKAQLPQATHNRGLLAKTLKVYFYLIACNGHCLLDDPVVESDKTQSSLARELKYDHRLIKQVLSILESAGYIKYNAQEKILTIDKDLYLEKPRDTGYVAQAALPEREEHDEHEPVRTETKPVIPAAVTEPKVPKEFIGFTKSTDGSKVLIIYYNTDIKERTTFVWCEGDGTPLTQEDDYKYRDLMDNGRASVYYNADDYWLYTEQRKAFREKHAAKAA